MADVDVKKEMQPLTKFHLLQAANYIVTTLVFINIARNGLDASPKFVSSLWHKLLQGEPHNALEANLATMFWLSPHCIGWIYALMYSHPETVYGTFLTAFMGALMAARMVATPAQYLINLILPVDGAMLVYKLMLLKGDLLAIPKSARKLLWNVPASNKRTTLCKFYEIQAYAMATYTFILSWVDADVLMPGYEGPRAPAYLAGFLTVQSVVFLGCVPGLRQGLKSAVFVVTLDKLLMCYIVVKSVYFDGCMPSTMVLWILIPYLGTLTLELYTVFWKYMMQYSVFDYFVTKSKAQNAQYFTLAFAAGITTVANLWYAVTGTGIASISPTFGQYFDRVAFLPGSDDIADLTRFRDVLFSGILFAFVIALNEVLDKDNTARMVSRIHFVLCLTVSLFSAVSKMMCNLQTTSYWVPAEVMYMSPNLSKRGIHGVFWCANVLIRLVIPLCCTYVLAYLDGPVSSWFLRPNANSIKESYIASKIVEQHTIRTAVKRTMTFHGIAMLLFTSLANSIITVGIPSFVPTSDSADYLVAPFAPNPYAQTMLFYAGLTISVFTVIFGSAMSSVNGRALGYAQVASVVWPILVWVYFIDRWTASVYHTESMLGVYLSPLFAGTDLFKSIYLPDIVVFGFGSIVLTTLIVGFVKVPVISMYNRKVQAPSDFAEELSTSQKLGYIYHGSMMILVCSVWMLYTAVTENSVNPETAFKDFMFEDIRHCMAMVNFGFLIYELRGAIHNRHFLSSMLSLNTYWINAGYTMVAASKVLRFFGWNSWRSELLDILSYLVYQVVIQVQVCNILMHGFTILWPDMNPKKRLILKTLGALKRTEEYADSGPPSPVLDGRIHSPSPPKETAVDLTRGDPTWTNKSACSLFSKGNRAIRQSAA